MPLRWEQIAEKVAANLRITGSDIVAIDCGQHTIPLANQLALACYRRGADVVLTLMTDPVFYGHLDALSAEQLRTPSQHCLGIAGYATVEIFLGGVEDPRGLVRVPAEKLIALSEGEKAHYDRLLERKLRVAYLMGVAGLTRSRAKTYKVSYGGWRRVLTRALNVNYARMTRFGRELAKRVEIAREVRVTAPNGTKLSFWVGGRRTALYDGVLDDEDVQRGVYSVQLPAGYLALAPIEASAEGVVEIDRPIPYRGYRVGGLHIEFSGGRVTQLTAQKNFEIVAAAWNRATGDKDRLGHVYFGLNPRAKYGYLMDQLVLGATTLGLGDNREIGGANNTSFFIQGTLRKATVELDRHPIVRNGRYLRF